MPVGTEVRINTDKDKTGKYGRYIAEVWVQKEDNVTKEVREVNLSDDLVKAGYAEYVEY